MFVNNVMLKKVIILFLMTLLFTISSQVASQNPTTEERLIRLEEGQKMLIQRIEDTNKRIEDTNKRIDDSNKRIDDLRKEMNQRFDDLLFWIQIVLGMLALVIAGLIAQFLLVWQRLIRVETKVKDHLSETEKDKLIAFQREEIEILKKRIDKLEVS